MSLVLGGIFSAIYALSTIPYFLLIDRFDRRKLFLVGAVGQRYSFLISLGCLTKETSENAKGAAVSLFLFIVFLDSVFSNYLGSDISSRDKSYAHKDCCCWCFYLRKLDQ